MMPAEDLRKVRRELVLAALLLLALVIVITIMLGRTGEDPPAVVVPITPAPKPEAATISDPVRPPLEAADGGSRAD